MKKLEVGDKVYCKKQRYRPDKRNGAFHIQTILRIHYVDFKL